MVTTTISCFLESEAQSRMLIEQLRAFGMYDQYQERVHGERILIAIQTRNLRERDIVRSILTDLGVTDFVYTEQDAA